MNFDTYKTLIIPKIDEFITQLNGRFKEHVSDEFIRVYLIHEIWKAIPRYANNMQNATYEAAQPLFETYIECGCVGYGQMNGHHVAQNFASLFKCEPLESLGE